MSRVVGLPSPTGSDSFVRDLEQHLTLRRTSNFKLNHYRRWNIVPCGSQSPGPKHDFRTYRPILSLASHVFKVVFTFPFPERPIKTRMNDSTFQRSTVNILRLRKCPGMCAPGESRVNAAMAVGWREGCHTLRCAGPLYATSCSCSKLNDLRQTAIST